MPVSTPLRVFLIIAVVAAAAAHAVYPVLQCITLARWPEVVDWTSWPAWLLVGVLAELFAIGITCLAGAGRREPGSSPANR